MKAPAAVWDAGWRGAPLMCSRWDQKPHLKGVINVREAAYSGTEGSTSFFGMLLCLRNMLLKSILQLYEPTRRFSISSFFFFFHRSSHCLYIYILWRENYVQH